MSTLNRLVLALIVGATPVAFAQSPPAEPPAGDPSSASSPHQRAATGQSGTAEAPATTSPDATSASSPHQQEAVGKSHGKEMKKMAGDMSAADPATFVKKAALGGMTEVATSKLAASKSQDPQVRSFAQKMVTDHSAANDELQSLAAKKGWHLPTSLDAEHKAIVQKLDSKSGADFDAAYSKQMREDHEKTVALFEGAARSSDADLAAWAQKTLPTLEKHEQLAASLPGPSHSAAASKPQREY